MWEDPYKRQNIEGAQKAINTGVGRWKKGDESLDRYVEEEFEARKDMRGGFWPGEQGHCKDQRRDLLQEAIKRKARNN